MIASIAGGSAATAPLAIMVKIAGHRAPDPDASLASAPWSHAVLHRNIRWN